MEAISYTQNLGKLILGQYKHATAKENLREYLV